MNKKELYIKLAKEGDLSLKNSSMLSKKTVAVQATDLPKSKKDTPFLDHCRKLLKEGYPEDTILEMYRGDVLCLRAKIVDGAKLTIDQDRSVFVKYQPLTKDKIAILRAAI